MIVTPPLQLLYRGSTPGVLLGDLLLPWHRPEDCDQLEAMPGKDFTWHQEELGSESKLQKTSHSPGASQRGQREKYSLMNRHHLNMPCPLLVCYCTHTCGCACGCACTYARTSFDPEHRAIPIYYRILFLPKPGMHAHMHTKVLPSTSGHKAKQGAQSSAVETLCCESPPWIYQSRAVDLESRYQDSLISDIDQERNTTGKMFLHHFSGKETLLNLIYILL